MSSRTRKKNIISNEATKPTSKRVENSWILLGKDELFQNSNFSIITLPHPANGKLSKYCLDDIHTKLYEVITYDEPNRSWFIGEAVKSDGNVMMLTPVNAIFLILPRLKEQCLKRAVPLEDLLSEIGFDKILDFVPNLDQVADLKGPPEIKAYKYNQDKTLQWLEDRVRKVAQVLRKKNIHVRAGAVSATFVASNVGKDSIDEEFYLKYAHGLVSEYLEEDLMEALENRFHFKPDLIETLAIKRKSEVDENFNANKKIKSESNEEFKVINNLCSPNEPKRDSKLPKVLTAKEKARQKAASGTKTLSSFFTKKS